jgi:SAM-dependent methyltransferase
MENPLPRMYTDFVEWWPLLSPPEDYAEEAEYYRKALLSASRIPVHSVLELGSGGGNNASYMKAHFQMTLVDLSPGMQMISRRLNPESEHILGDMRSLRLGRFFDAVFVHDAVMYMTSLEDLRLAIQTAFVHLRPGGSALFAPDYTRESFHPDTDCGGKDSLDRGMRYLEWTNDPDPSDTTFTTDFAYLLRQPDGRVHCEYDQHVMGLFSRAEWLQLLTETGFQAQAIPFEHSELESGIYELFLCSKPE